MAVIADELEDALLDEALADLYDELGLVTITAQFVSRYPPLTSKTFSPCSVAGDFFPAWYTTFIEVINSGGSPVTCTVATPGEIENIPEGAYQFTVPANGDTEAGPFPPHLFGKITQITYSDPTSLSIAVKRYGD